jgi:nucleotide sugar dehydrogenase
MNVCVLGLGYVGLTLSLALADSGIKVYGVDSNEKVVLDLKRSKPSIKEKNSGFLLKKHINKKFYVSKTIPDNTIDVFVISVGTPLAENNAPILDYVMNSSQSVAKKLKKGQVVILRSTVPVGTTRNVVNPILEKISKLKAGRDFGIVFAPERTVEGVAIEEMRSLPQIIGGINEKAVLKAKNIFKKLTPTIVPVSSIETAEMIKLIDNTYRDSRFAYANEIAMICELLNIDAKECISKANYKYARNNVPVPSPGVGGPCLSKDSHLLINTARQFNYIPNLIIHSRWVNEFVPAHLASKIIRKLKNTRKNIKNSKVFVIGFAFKGNPETADIRNSSTLILINELKKTLTKLYGYDPVVPNDEIEKLGVITTSVEKGFEKADCVVIMNNHKSYSSIPISQLLKKTSKPCVFVDCWSMFENIAAESDVIYTGVGID